MNEIIEMGTLSMESALETLNSRLQTLRTGRANVSVLHGILVDYYGTPTPLEQIASLSVVEGRQLLVKPFDPSSLKDMERAIGESPLGLPIQNDGSVLRINVPQLTEDARRDVSKNVGVYAEESKIAIRNIRRDLNDDVKKLKDLPEDDERGLLEEVQKLTDSYIKKIDDIAKAKVADIMSI
ncbi:ribosome recycling factor [Erysipelothrix sp. HDW6A]|uniref:ribosome recycling factor n=1 Tax=Erysipelothrix sp. HDW6A TaxID=2714928 RepID=UPI001409C7FF|nr:ribosome recycling factor [Erysipelothrix sp. HDW6A]QIK57585.1 ribosome recycling factor [Erysipelothrix sp. HDW6A]